MGHGPPKGDGSLRRLLFSRTAHRVSHLFVMEWPRFFGATSIIGLLIAGVYRPRVLPLRSVIPFSSPTTRPCAALWFPHRSARSGDHVVRLLDRNVPIASVLGNGRNQLRRVAASTIIFADLLILPILNIYRKDYGTR